MNKKIGMIAGAVALAGVVGTGIYHAEASSSNEGQVQIVEEENITMEDATKKLEEEYQGTIKELELDKEGNKLYYEAEIIVENQEYDVKMDAGSGEVVYEEVDDDGYDDDRYDDDRNMEENQQDTTVENENSNSKSNLIAQEKAVKIAKQQFDGEVVDMELDYDDGRYVYEFELVNGQQEADIDIHGETGDILSLEVEYEDD
ncbi:PepSY domain-containing protein [Oceanobacillus jeddahense]|uniref:PepSY domain-containing protein n=1 Tax=Oceanobacillus jeddahense TaxID=1462527 RepID=UPI000693AFEE|nr:PepSY domain-containing protein [Oceanobacillus jeddahense]